MTRSLLLSVLLLTCTSPSWASRPGTDAPQTLPCPGCEDILKKKFKELAVLGGFGAEVDYVHRGDFNGVGLVCDPAKSQLGEFDDGLSPAVARTCGKKSRVATASSVFSVARACEVEGVEASLEDSLASVLAHELAHIANGDSKQWEDELKRVCDAWAPGFKTSAEGKALGRAIMAENAGKSQAQVNMALMSGLLDTCIKKNEKLQAFARGLESKADVDGQNLMSTYRGKAGEAAFICTMKGVGDYAWAIESQIPVDSPKTHPDPAVRVISAKQAYGITLLAQAREYCAKSPSSPLCVFVPE